MCGSLKVPSVLLKIHWNLKIQLKRIGFTNAEKDEYGTLSALKDEVC